MARTRGDGPVTLSLLDRLIDEDPKRSEEVPLTRAQSLREFKAAVRRDLEWLLNTRQPLDIAVGPQLRNSLYTYGLPDIASFSVLSVRDRQRLTHAIEEAVTRFEPRIAAVKVSLADTSSGEKAPNLRFVIDGMLRVDPSPEPVSFDTMLDLANGEYRVPGD
ncbi:MAG TPA: type VI secretion system baseplate subunit TssE [Bryobacteraceae bacterium]|jgi:type VI secretion system protein ImpF